LGRRQRMCVRANIVCRLTSLGSALFTGLTVTAALLASVLLDHMGWIGFKEHPASLLRLCGTALMVAGLVLVALF